MVRVEIRGMRVGRSDPVLAVMTALLLALGVMVLVGWAFDLPLLSRIRPNWTPMVVNTAVSFVACGCVLGLLQSNTRHAPALAAVLGGLVAALATVVLLDILFDFAPGLALPDLHRPLQPDSPRPGRMAPNTALAFMIAGAAFAVPGLFPRRRTGAWLEAAGFAVGTIGLLGLVGYSLQLEYLYAWTGVVRMAVHTAIGMLLLGVGILRWVYVRRQMLSFEGDELRGIFKVAALVIAVVTLAAGLLGFSVLQARVDGVLRTQMQAWSHERRVYLDVNLRLRSQNADIAAWDTTLPQDLQALLSTPAESQVALRKLQHWAAGLDAHGFTAIGLEISGRRWMLAGRFTQDPQLSVEVRGDRPTRLLWKDGYRLRRDIRLSEPGSPPATLLTEQSLSFLDRISELSPEWGETGEVVTCAHGNGGLDCFPMRSRPHAFHLPLKPGGVPWPVERAVNGEAGVAAALDVHGTRVIAGFGPVGDTGIGLVTKMDTAEIYAPVRRQLQLAIPALVLLMLMGLYVLHLRLQPLLLALTRSRAQLAASEMRFAAVIDSAQDAFVFLQPLRDGNGHIGDFGIVLVNAEGERQLRTDRSELVGQPLSRVLSRRMRPELLMRYRLAVENGKPDALDIESTDPVDGPRWHHHQMVPVGDGLAVTMRDITEQRRLSELHRYQAMHDSLTGLPNRAGFESALDALLLRAREDCQTVAVAMFDIDHFKQVNDLHGHHAGDQLLREVARRLSESVRPGDLVARLGGDEFVLAIHDTEYPRGMTALARKLVDAMARPFQTGVDQLDVGISLGACAAPGHGRERAILLGRADAAMYRAKQGGRGRYEVQAWPELPSSS